MAEYYDYVLAAMPLTVLTVAGVLALAGISLSLAIPAGAGASLPLVGHALFVRAPIPAAEPSPAPAETGAASHETGFDAAD